MAKVAAAENKGKALAKAKAKAKGKQDSSNHPGIIVSSNPKKRRGRF